MQHAVQTLTSNLNMCTLCRKDGLRKIAKAIGEQCNDEELDEIIEFCSEGDEKIDKETFLRVCKHMRLF